MGTMKSSTLQVKHSNEPDESRPFTAHGHADIHKIGQGAVMRAVFEPGWRWSVDVAPIAGTKSCQAPHLGYVISGKMIVRMDDGSEQQLGPGDFFHIAPGHDGWVIGDEPCVMVDFAGYEDYAKRRTPAVSSERTREAVPREKH
ncbi:hypothetical protein AKJ09_02209 [Labilithrix luteola]|uniref:Cupin type-2 domain-containing protein n=1 Tax=Labilithrix luteola TaxID=1391654 RepID=A0A0K1PPS8_9BACT|nr:cupin domain-containing protein [Labilithrix luteola]AKU95545.1 hypothetical protein AKJ09_02209 [Labilithrix luteola]